jgi:oligosaccharide repeat unit polymerase
MIFALLSFIFTLSAIGARLGDLLSPNSIINLAQAATYRRYTEGLDFPIYYNISNAFFISYCMILAKLLAYRVGASTLHVIPIAIYISTNMLITTRAPILFALIISIFTFIYCYRERYGYFPHLLSRRSFKIVTLMAIAISGIFFFFQVLRFGEHSTRSAADVWEHLRKWPWGSLPGFSLWFDDPSSAQTDTVPGFYTFMGIYDLFGIATRQVGGYADYLALGESSSEFANIYTAFRGLWHDFGAIGSAAFMFAFGYVAARAAMSNQEFLGLALPLYVSIMSFVAFSFVVSILAFTANLVGIFSFVYISKFFFSNNPQPTEREGIVRHAGD